MDDFNLSIFIQIVLEQDFMVGIILYFMQVLLEIVILSYFIIIIISLLANHRTQFIKTKGLIKHDAFYSILLIFLDGEL